MEIGGQGLGIGEVGGLKDHCLQAVTREFRPQMIETRAYALTGRERFNGLKFNGLIAQLFITFSPSVPERQSKGRSLLTPFTIS